MPSDGNALLVTRPGDRASSNYLDNLREQQQGRLDKLDAEITEAKRRLSELGATPRADPVLKPPTSGR